MPPELPAIGLCCSFFSPHWGAVFTRGASRPHLQLPTATWVPGTKAGSRAPQWGHANDWPYPLRQRVLMTSELPI